MSDQHDQPIEKTLDKELNLRGIWIFGIAILVLTAVGAAIAWGVSVKLRATLEAQDPPRPVLLEARSPLPPPEPRLQANPPLELKSYMTEQERLLTTYEWVDEAGGVARVPVERAKELALELGLESPAPAESIEESGAE